MCLVSLEHALRSELPHHWLETEAEVTDCTYARFRAYIDGSGVEDQIAHYAVGFTYTVDGKAYSGVLSSPVEVEHGDKFALRYNPEDPAENNSIYSQLGRPWFKIYTFAFGAAIVAAGVYELLQRYSLHR